MSVNYDTNIPISTAFVSQRIDVFVYKENFSIFQIRDFSDNEVFVLKGLIFTELKAVVL